MKRHILATGLLLVFGLCTFGQQRANDKGGTRPAARKVPEAAVFLATSALAGGTIPDRVFDSLARQPITARDKDGAAARVLGFTVTFAERTIAEDSAGNPLVSVDYYSEICTGDTLNAILRNNLFERTKPGDTVWYDRIRVATAAGEAGGKGMKFVIGR